MSTADARASEPSLASVQDAVSEILSNEGLTFAAKSSYDSRQVYSLQEAAVRTGVAVEWMTGSVKASFGGDWMSRRTSIMVRSSSFGAGP